jgi:chemotaxis protein methyltransferase CheR
MIAISNKEFKELTEYIQLNYGVNLSRKRHLIEGRLANLLIDKEFKSFAEYLRHVFTDHSKLELTDLINRLTTNHTFFMREANHFDYFRDTVLPILKSTTAKKDLRVWSAGCSSGQEPYTLAMIMKDFFGHEKSLWDTKVLATDISVQALAIAEKGVYSEEGVQDLPAIWKASYFHKMDQQNFQVVNKLKAEVVFRVFNLMDGVFPFKKKFHVIFCRNVMIYFDHKTKMQLIDKFYDLTESGGYLFIGHTESIGRSETAYRYVMPAVYRKE